MLVISAVMAVIGIIGMVITWYMYVQTIRGLKDVLTAYADNIKGTQSNTESAKKSNRSVNVTDMTLSAHQQAINKWRRVDEYSQLKKNRESTK